MLNRSFAAAIAVCIAVAPVASHAKGGGHASTSSHFSKAEVIKIEHPKEVKIKPVKAPKA
jgi:hypothetical protein